jgi:hypothetical protein
MSLVGRTVARCRACTLIFKEPFAGDGEVYVIDRHRVRSISEANSGQIDLLADVQSLKV